MEIVTSLEGGRHLELETLDLSYNSLTPASSLPFVPNSDDLLVSLCKKFTELKSLLLDGKFSLSLA